MRSTSTDLVPFSYFGVADNLDLRDIPWRRGRGYDVQQLTTAITATDVWARAVVQAVPDRLVSSEGTRALGFCVSVDHARYMARVFNDSGIPATAVWADTPDQERLQALSDLAAGRVNVVFSVDLFNEGVDVPTVNSLMMLRPTESPLLFLQQLGRGLRKAPDKALCTVLDFVGQHRKEFRYDRRFQALLGGSRSHVARQVSEGFPVPAVRLQHAARSCRNRTSTGKHQECGPVPVAGESRMSCGASREERGHNPSRISRGVRSRTGRRVRRETIPGLNCAKRQACQRLRAVHTSKDFAEQ